MYIYIHFKYLKIFCREWETSLYKNKYVLTNCFSWQQIYYYYPSLMDKKTETNVSRRVCPGYTKN